MFSNLIQLALQNLIYFALHLEHNGAFPPKLSKEEEKKCLEGIARGEHSARNKLIEHNLRLVAFIVKKQYVDFSEHDDLISIGVIGLISAVETFKPDKKISFSTYASKCIDNQIKMHFRKTKKLQSEVYMNEPIESGNDNNQIALMDVFRDPINIEDSTELRIDLQKLYNYINEELDLRERQIICMRYGLTRYSNKSVKVEKAMTQQEVADNLGISRSYVSRIEKKALETLKARFELNKYNQQMF